MDPVKEARKMLAVCLAFGLFCGSVGYWIKSEEGKALVTFAFVPCAPNKGF